MVFIGSAGWKGSNLERSYYIPSDISIVYTPACRFLRPGSRVGEIPLDRDSRGFRGGFE